MPTIEISERLNQRFLTEFKGQSIETLINSGLNAIGHDPKTKWRLREGEDKKWRWSYIDLSKPEPNNVIASSEKGWIRKEDCEAIVKRLRDSRNAQFDMPLF